VKVGKSQVWNKGVAPSQTVPSPSPSPKLTTSPTPTVQDNFRAKSYFADQRGDPNPDRGDQWFESIIDCWVQSPGEYQVQDSFISIFDPSGSLLVREPLTGIYNPFRSGESASYWVYSKEMIKNSGKGQVFTLFNNLRANTNVSNPYGTTLRQGYAPGYSDDRVNKGELNKDGINPNIYARTDGNGLVIDFLMGEANSPITSGNYERSKQVSDDGWDRDYYGKTWSSFKGAQYTNAFGWQDSKYNKDKKEGTLGITDDTQKTLFTTSTDGKNRKKTLLIK
jgi:hypothetical protein